MAASDLVQVGEYIVIQRQDYFKLHKITANGNVTLGKDNLEISSVIGKRYWTTYRMEQKKGGKRNYELRESVPEHCDKFNLNVSIMASGSDNRNISDDGSSQKLSMEEIVSLRDEGLSSKEILGTLIENSKTFHTKTEYSQQKYLKKKEKKYFEYITVRRPSVRLIAEILYRQDPGKIMGLRIDTLSQLSTAVNLHSCGTYILYESGCQALPAAVLLNGLSEGGRLIHIHPGNTPQKQALNAMNLTEEQKNSILSVNIYSLLRKLRGISEEREIKGTSQKADSTKKSGDSIQNPLEPLPLKPENETKEESTPEEMEDGIVNVQPVPQDRTTETVPEQQTESTSSVPKEENEEASSAGKRKHSGDADDSERKRPRWELDTEKAASILQDKADGLVLVCREDPGNILKAFLPYIAPSRNFVVFCSLREPLQELLLELKNRSDVIYLRLTDTWLRNYQVETNRTHPLVNMTGSGGYLLTGVVVEKS